MALIQQNSPSLVNFAKFLVILFSQNFANGQYESNDCTPRTPINMTLPQIDGTWYAAIFVNETHAKEQMSCIRLSYRYNPETEMTTEEHSAIPHGKTEVEIYSADYGMASPGVTNVTIPPDTRILARFMEYTANETSIVSVCQQINGTKSFDRIVMMVRERSMISKRLIHRKLHQVGVYGHRYNSYYWVPQTDCPN